MFLKGCPREEIFPLQIKNRRRLVVFAALTAAWMAVIFLFSAQNGDESSGTSAEILALLCCIFRYSPDDSARELLTLLIRKAAHMTEFGVLALLWLGTLRAAGIPRYVFPASFAASSLYAATDEIHQLFVSDRAGRFTDWLIDSSGALLFLLIAWGISLLSARSHRAESGDNL